MKADLRDLFRHRIAVTGSIGGGKSTFLGYLSEMGFETLSADVVVAEMWEDSEFRMQVGGLFGVVAEVDKNFVREKISEDGENRRRLNSLVHAEVLARMGRSPALIFEIPLLFESCLWGLFGGVVVVTCSEEVRHIRLVERYGAESAAGVMRGMQLRDEVKVAIGDVVVRTDEGFDSVKNRAVALEAWIRTCTTSR